MPKIPDDMSNAAIDRRAVATQEMKAAEKRKADAAGAPPPPKPRMAKRR